MIKNIFIINKQYIRILKKKRFYKNIVYIMKYLKNTINRDDVIFIVFMILKL